MFAVCADGLNKGFIVTKKELPAKPSHRKGKLTDRTKLIRDVVREVRTPCDITENAHFSCVAVTASAGFGRCVF